MSPPVAIASTRTPVFCIQSSLRTRFSGAEVAVWARLVLAANRT
jgi:hypothetical protein